MHQITQYPNAYQYILQNKTNLFTKTCQSKRKKQLFNQSHLCLLVINIINKILINEIQAYNTKVIHCDQVGLMNMMVQLGNGLICYLINRTEETIHLDRGWR